MKTLFTICISLLTFGSSLMAQQTFQPRPIGSGEMVGLIYDREAAADIRLHTNGFAFAMNFGKIKTYYKTKYYQIEIGELKHPKEFRNPFDVNPNGRGSSFIYGKRNNLYVLRGGIGTKRYFSEKAKKRGIAVGASYNFGPSIGLLKPYQLTLRYPTDSPNGGNVEVNESYSEENHDQFTDHSFIVGAAGFSKGFADLKIRPGVHAKAGLHFALGAFDEVVKAFEAGVMVDWFFSEVPMMIPLDNNENKSYFLNLYLNLQFGKRW
ncbi:MAG: hypothetical protein HKN16_06130 [Saprospiraceae bacterium]|nr:hypothetical protein [Saprospiraceae bacterium]